MRLLRRRCLYDSNLEETLLFLSIARGDRKRRSEEEVAIPKKKKKKKMRRGFVRGVAQSWLLDYRGRAKQGFSHALLPFLDC